MSEIISAKPGATYKFTVRSADEAVQTIRARLGENAKVLSVRQVEGGGIGALFSKPKLEVIAQVGEDPSTAPPASAPMSEESVLPGSSGSSRSALPLSAYNLAASEEVPVRHPAGIDFSGRRDTPTPLPQLLRRSGFSESMMSRLEQTPAFIANAQQPLHRGLSAIGQQLRKSASARKPRLLPARSAFLGTPGVGRTTALCKWLAKEVFSRQRVGRVLKAEFDRPNPAEGLGVFCEALGLSVEYYAPDRSELPSTVGGPASEFLYADLPGLSLREGTENAQLAKFLEREKFHGRVLVLNAVYDASLLRRTYAVGTDLGATHVVFTHLDELDHWGRLWDFLLEGPLMPLFLATGPSLTGDCEENVVESVLRKTLPGA